MNKFMFCIFVILLLAATCIGCSDNSCDEPGCRRNAKNVSSETKKVFTDLGIEGDYCKQHQDEKFKAALSNLGGMNNDFCSASECYKKAKEIDENTRKVLDDAGSKGQYCETHLAIELEKALNKTQE